MSLLAFLAAAIAAAPQPEQIVVRSIEPVPSRTVEDRQVWTCPSGLRIDILTSTRPRPRPGRRDVVIIINGTKARGAFASQMANDLSQRGVYRVSVRCAQDRQTAHVITSKGRKGENGVVTYWDSSASFTTRGIIAYRGMEPSNEESFWYN
jgi:hypothetical protein